MLVRALSMIPLEVIVRNLAAGSIVRNYPFKEGTRLNPPVIVIDYKDDSRHDPMLNDDLIVALKISATPQELKKIKKMALQDQRPPLTLICKARESSSWISRLSSGGRAR